MKITKKWLFSVPALLVLMYGFLLHEEVHAETIYTATTPTQYRDLVIQKIKEGVTPIKINYTGKQPLVGTNDYFTMVYDYMNQMPSLNYYPLELMPTIGHEYNESLHAMLVRWDISYRDTFTEETWAFQQVDSIMQKIITPGMNDEQKLHAITKYLYDNVEYGDERQLLDYTAYGALKNGTAVCQGYTALAQLMFNKAGIPSYVVSGLAMGEPHAWNEIQINGLWRHVDTTWNESYDPNWDKDYPFNNKTTNQMINMNRQWDYDNLPATPDSPILKPFDRSQAQPVPAKVYRKNNDTYLKVSNVKNGDVIVIYDVNMNYIANEEVFVDTSKFPGAEIGLPTQWDYPVNDFDINLSQELNTDYLWKGKFYITRTTEFNPESIPNPIEYDLRVPTAPILASNISIQNNLTGNDIVTIKGTFGYSGTLHLYNENGQKIDDETIYENSNDIKFIVSDINKLGKTLSISAEQDFGIESSKTSIAIPEVPRSSSIIPNQVSFTYINADGKLTVTNVDSSDLIKIYNADTKGLIVSGKGSTTITIPNAISLHKLLITRTSISKTESNSLLYELPKIPTSTGISSNQISFTYENSNKDGKIIIKNISGTDTIKIYNADTKKIITSGKGSNSITITNISNYRTLLITKTSIYQSESNTYLYQVPKPTPLQTPALKNTNIKVSKYGTKIKMIFSGIKSNTLVTLYIPNSSNKITSFYYKTSVVYLSNLSKYSSVSITLKEEGKTESSKLNVTIPKR